MTEWLVPDPDEACEKWFEIHLDDPQRKYRPSNYDAYEGFKAGIQWQKNDAAFKILKEREDEG